MTDIIDEIDQPAPVDIKSLFATRAKIWATRDACPAHYPFRCPEQCGNAGIHNGSLGTLCECRACEVSE